MKGFCLVAAFSVLIAGCSSKPMGSDSKSNWLRECTGKSDCKSGLECVCGVCTKACETAAACDSVAGRDVACVDPDGKDLPAACGAARAVKALNICLQSCSKASQCGTRQACEQGVCIGALLVAEPGAGSASQESDTGSRVQAASLDTGMPQVQEKDGSSRSVDPSFDATGAELGDTGTSPPVTEPPVTAPPPPSPDDDTGTPANDCTVWPYQCFDGFVCHVDRTCMPRGQTDANGVTTLDDSMRNALIPYGLVADPDYVYGYDIDSIKRWPTTGGPGQLLASSVRLLFASSGYMWSPLLLDGATLYFVAFANDGDLSASLFTMPKDGSAAPTAHALVGHWLVQDADYLYFSNDGDSRVYRQPKAMLDASAAREEVYRSTNDAPLTIAALALNSSSLFVSELPPHAPDAQTFSIHRVDKTNKQASLLATSDKFTTSVIDTVADDNYLVVLGSSVDRMDLSSGEVKPLTALQATGTERLVGGQLYLGGGYTSNSGLQRIDLATGHSTALLTQYSLLALGLAVSPDALSLDVSVQDLAKHQPGRIVRIALP